MAFLSLEERRALSQRTSREQVACPVCGGKAEMQRNGDWTCVNAMKLDGWRISMYVQTCSAKGVRVGEDLVPTRWPHKETDADA